jgi:uncharacterized Ntn-hydrolase superfamily protein
LGEKDVMPIVSDEFRYGCAVLSLILSRGAVIEWVLAQFGAVTTEQEEDPRKEMDRAQLRGAGSRKTRFDSDDE